MLVQAFFNTETRQGSPWPQRRPTPRRPAVREGGKSPLKKRHLVWILVILALTHLSHLMAEKDEIVNPWGPPVEPPCTIVVTRSNHKPPSPEPIQNSIPAKPAVVNAMVPLPASNNSEADLRETLQQWSQAWSQQNLPLYLSLYATNFKAPKGMSRSAWVMQRTKRISSKKKIQHSISDLSIQMRATTATVRFTQTYQDERLRLIEPKTMLWTFKEGRWLITLETTE